MHRYAHVETIFNAGGGVHNYVIRMRHQRESNERAEEINEKIEKVKMENRKTLNEKIEKQQLNQLKSYY